MLMCSTLVRQVDWAAPENQPVKPKLIGTKAFIDFPLEDVLDYIDWNPFFQVHICFCELTNWLGTLSALECQRQLADSCKKVPTGPS